MSMDFNAPFSIEDIGLTPDEVFNGLLDHGLFCEKLPPCFSSEGLSAINDPEIRATLDGATDSKLAKAIGNRSHDFIRYAALRDTNVPRHLGVPHPESYFVQALAIKKHWNLIKEHCLQGYPHVSRIFVRHTKGGQIFEMSYKAPERYALEETELKWQAGAQYRVDADISSCFPSIYTHSIPWALHTQEVAKKKESRTSLIKLPGNLLDKCTRVNRDGQTNGLLIGPHASNIIAEIVLTCVDRELVAKDYIKLSRHIDDYCFYAKSHEEAEKFIHDLGLVLRKFELNINDKKTRILRMPQTSDESWVQHLKRFQFPAAGEIRYSTIRSLLDLALELSEKHGISTPLNFALKMIGNNEERVSRYNSRARRLFVQEAINLAIAFPYLAPTVESKVFSVFKADTTYEHTKLLSDNLFEIGVRKLYPDAIAHGLYISLKGHHQYTLSSETESGILAVEDCIVLVLFREYAQRHGKTAIVAQIDARALSLRTMNSREQDRFWLLLYQVLTADQLLACGQTFLCKLKNGGFNFVKL